MSALQFVLPLYSHMEWADAAVWQRTLATPGAAEDKVLRQKLVHLHAVQRAFLMIWRGDPLVFPSLEDFADLPSIARWGRSHHTDLTAHLATLDDDATGASLKLPWSDRLVATFGRTAAPTTLGETMLQVPMHSTYHRGQINMRLRELGGEPPLVDYIAWLWLDRPAPQWPEEVGS